MGRLKKRGKVFLTGRPGSGKTTIVKRIVETIKERGLSVGGMISSEIRIMGSRVGFEIIDLLTGRRGILAHVDQKEGPKISKYRVNVYDLVDVGVSAISSAIDKADLVVIDEVGPMELYSREFKEVVEKAIESEKLIVGTIHYKARDPLIEFIKSRKDVEIYEVTPYNRARIEGEIVEKLLRSTKERCKQVGN